MPRLSKIGAAALGAFGWTGLSSITASYLQVAGGGPGGGHLNSGHNPGGGGGAGGYLTGSTSLSLALSYTVTVGAGGAGTTGQGSNGSNSQFGTLTASVGGGGGGTNGGASSSSNINGTTGGSGGGGGSYTSGGTGGSGTVGQGNAGGNGSASPIEYGGGGGGGAGATGAVGTSTAGGNGGAGTASSITGSSVTYAGGGGGAAYTNGPAGTGGAGGGGAGNYAGSGTSGTANLGGGGGGSCLNGTGNQVGGNGGSGVVIISYLGAQQFGGGVVTSSGGYTIHTFNTSGTLAPLSSLTASYLIVAGGAGGGLGRGGGGGAGGLLSGSGVTIDTNSNYLVTVGSGGTGSTSSSSAGSSGSSSAFSMVTTTSVGGGGGGSAALGPGITGGSGGGGGGAASGNTGGSGTSGQGNAGGNSVVNNAGGGGGGSSSVGVAGSGATGGNGGNGTASSISGSSVSYAGGGGAGAGSGGSGGTGQAGGGNGGGNSGNGGNATANSGSGGGGGGDTAPRDGGNGGSGVVIISYAGATQSMAGGTVTISGGNVIHTFTSSGYLTPLKFVGNSLRTRSSASAYLSRTFTQSGNTQKFTQSVWCKRGTLGALQTIGYTFFTGTYNGQMRFSAGDTLEIYVYYDGSSYTGQLTTTQVFRDPAAWYHLVLAVDTTQATAANRIKFYVNGVQVTALSTANYPNQNQALVWNASGNTGYFINAQQGSAYFFDGYMTELNYIDGQQLTPNSFGTFNSYGVWQPITYGGSYGTNGFYLPFGQGSSTYAASFNGSSQRLLTSTSASLALGTNDFTVEYWVYFNATTVGQIPVTGGDGTTNYDAQFGYYDTGNILSLYLSSNGSTWGISSGQTIGAVTTGKWYNVAITRSGSTFYTFLNGVQGSTFTSSSSISQSANSFGIGKAQASNYVNGYISNVRVIIGTCLYTTNFVPSTTPLTAVTNTKLLTLQNATIVDNSTNALTFTNTGSVTTAVQYPFLANITLDSSPAGNNWTSNNIGVLNNSSLDSMTDVPTLTSATVANYATLNPLDYVNSNTSSLTLTNGNLLATRSTTSYGGYPATMALPTSTAGGGKFVFEITSNNLIDGSTNELYIGFGVQSNGTFTKSSSTGSAADFYTAVSITGGTGQVYKNISGSYSLVYTGVAIAANDVFQFLVDMTNGTVDIKKNGSAYGTQITGLPTTIPLFPFISMYGSISASANFGQQPFASTPTSGYLALNAYNI
jgi:hypothetical protein